MQMRMQSQGLSTPWLDSRIDMALAGSFSLREELLNEASQIHKEHLQSFTDWAIA